MWLFLHGFLGQKEDWDPLLSHLPSSIKAKAIDLPGHGELPMVEDLAEEVATKQKNASVIVGYSAGGRLALEMKARFPKRFGKVMALSTHPGLHSIEEREKRWKKDLEWATLLENIPFDEWLRLWYNQPLFASLKKDPHFPAMLERRKKQNPEALVQFLLAFSLSKKSPPELFPDTVFISGALDLHYAKLYRKLTSSKEIPDAGHALHIEKPKECAELLIRSAQ
ncbi:MAG: 2-succinyl-6-hydroxy-2,4-cyclohexadiene-1-carboxylate synthase [Chlamydiae bacterium]|nr:2-succinyl-6-hydroxy-2,4-cyclohexadiene-1-carboxylate synthase [Chlamydiota bacterium]